MKPLRPLAFVDLETTGLGPGTHRIAEIGVVTLDEEGTAEPWATLVNPGGFAPGRYPPSRYPIEGVSDEELAAAPRFAEIAHDLGKRLRGRLLVAHNARFDYAFLKAEFERAGVRFEAPALCTVMLSRKLYPHHASHNLDALMQRHGLAAQVRHRALPDAQLLHQFWQVIARDFPARRIWAVVDNLLAEPLLPPHLDLGLVHALPEKPGVYLMRGERGEVLRIGRAANLRREAKAYFRLDRISARGAKLACQVRNIEWQVSEGEIAARLDEITLAEKEGPARPAGAWTICVDPARTPIAKIIPAAETVSQGERLFGLFASERKAANALARLASRDSLCHALLGLGPANCSACAGGACGRAQPQRLVRALTSMSGLRLQPWPYSGPVGVREGRTVHVFDQWQWLGSAKTAPEMAQLAIAQPRGFNREIFNVLTKALPRLSARRVRTLGRPARNLPAGSSLDPPPRIRQ